MQHPDRETAGATHCFGQSRRGSCVSRLLAIGLPPTHSCRRKTSLLPSDGSNVASCHSLVPTWSIPPWIALRILYRRRAPEEVILPLPGVKLEFSGTAGSRFLKALAMRVVKFPRVYLIAASRFPDVKGRVHCRGADLESALALFLGGKLWIECNFVFLVVVVGWRYPALLWWGEVCSVTPILPSVSSGLDEATRGNFIRWDAPNRPLDK